MTCASTGARSMRLPATWMPDCSSNQPLTGAGPDAGCLASSTSSTPSASSAGATPGFEDTAFADAALLAPATSGAFAERAPEPVADLIAAAPASAGTGVSSSDTESASTRVSGTTDSSTSIQPSRSSRGASSNLMRAAATLVQGKVAIVSQPLPPFDFARAASVAGSVAKRRPSSSAARRLRLS